MLLMVGVTARVVGRFGFKPPIVAGLFLLALGIGLFARVPAEGSFLGDVLWVSLIAAVGMSLAYIPVLVASLSSAAPEEAGLASGLVNTSYQVGSAIGLAAMTAVATSVGDGDTTGGLIDGYEAAFLGAAGIAAAAALVALTLIRRPRTAAARAGEAPQAELAA
jgi:MFS family permease